MRPRARSCCARTRSTSPPATSGSTRRTSTPGLPRVLRAGRHPALHTFPAGWGTQATKLQGNNAHVYTDVNDNNAPDAPFGNCPECGEVGAEPGGRELELRLPAQPAPEPSQRNCFTVFPQCSWSVERPPGSASAGATTCARTRPRSTSTSTTSTTGSRRPVRLHRGGRQLRGRRRGQRRDPRRRQHRHLAGLDPRDAGPRPHQQREHEHARRRHPAADADVPVRRAQRQLGARVQRRRRRLGDLPRVHPRALEPARARLLRQPGPARASSRARWARAGATGTRWTTSRATTSTRPTPPTTAR